MRLAERSVAFPGRQLLSVIAQNSRSRLQLKVQEECFRANDSTVSDWEKEEAVLSRGGD
jgi:hypothetical protein